MLFPFSAALDQDFSLWHPPPCSNNAGLSRRFDANDPWVFVDYSGDELKDIFWKMLNDAQLSTTPSVVNQAVTHLELQRSRPNFGNAGAIETMIKTGATNFSARMRAASEARDAAIAAGKPLPPMPRPELILQDMVRDPTSVEKAMSAFDNLVGVPQIMTLVDDLVAIVEDCLAETPPKKPSDALGDMHFCIYGPKGTGKSDTARCFGQFFYNLGVLAKPTVKETTADKLMGAYVGQTAPLVEAVLKEAAGGILLLVRAPPPHWVNAAHKVT